MQNLVKTALTIFNSGKSTSPSALPKNGKNQKMKNVNGKCRTDVCFEVGYNSVKRATIELMQALERERAHRRYFNRYDMCCKWNSVIENMLVKDISAHFPYHQFITKNTRKGGIEITLTSCPTWFIEPLGGVTNFVHGFPFANISLAYWTHKRPRFGIIWNPLLDKCYVARSGIGSYVNVNPIRVSQCRKLSDALVMYNSGLDGICNPEGLTCIRNVLNEANGLRCLGNTSLNMCMVAQGVADAFFDFNCNSLDMSAAILLVKEAGGVVLDTSLSPIDITSGRVLCACTQELAEELSSVLYQSEQRKPSYEKSAKRKKQRRIPFTGYPVLSMFESNQQPNSLSPTDPTLPGEGGLF